MRIFHVDDNSSDLRRIPSTQNQSEWHSSNRFNSTEVWHQGSEEIEIGLLLDFAVGKRVFFQPLNVFSLELMLMNDGRYSTVSPWRIKHNCFLSIEMTDREFRVVSHLFFLLLRILENHSGDPSTIPSLPLIRLSHFLQIWRRCVSYDEQSKRLRRKLFLNR